MFIWRKMKTLCEPQLIVRNIVIYRKVTNKSSIKMVLSLPNRFSAIQSLLNMEVCFRAIHLLCVYVFLIYANNFSVQKPSQWRVWLLTVWEERKRLMNMFVEVSVMISCLMSVGMCMGYYRDQIKNMMRQLNATGMHWSGIRTMFKF